ncbi:hypothetical protein LUZ61_013960 [Rhynchospora tenuis]|uniref:Uncharacterized protein n=1 Tax=Rhynchospora tenuis TaxID=198213 RepID=A0AAD5WA73_9POAL|nr:hypothetical protein LUZ61_013960 [Rhynchospora tenuis]
MEEQSKNEDNIAPILCRNNCGFFGSQMTNNLCSKCYKEYCFRNFNSSIDLRDEQNEEKEEEKEKSIGEMDAAQVTGLVVEPVDPSKGTPVQLPVKKPANRCAVCIKKVGLMGFKCRCENVFCSVHRYSDQHDCNFNYREAGQDAIAKANPIVKADKIDKF